MNRPPTAADRTWRRRGWVVAGMPLVFALTMGAVAAQGAMNSSTTSAALQLTGRAELGSLARLWLTATELTFDLQRPLDAPDAPTCVTGPAPDDTTAGAFGVPATVAPAGTSYRSVGWPNVEVVGGNALASYPPPSGSADLAVVCYRTFVLEPFANADGWQLSVSRSDLIPGAAGLQLYLAGTCRGEPDAGLQVLGDGATLVLASERAAGTCGAMLGVLAVRVDDVAAGEVATELRYTLLTADAAFGVGEEERP